MHPLFELLPLLFFVVAYKLAGIYVATGVLIVGVLAVTLVSWIRHRKVKPLLLVTAAVVLVFGGLTIYLHDPMFIKWKPTIISWLFAGVFLGSQFMKGPNILERLLGTQLQEALGAEKKLDSATVWARANLAWVAFNVFLGALNLWVAFNFSESTWVYFKLFGLMGLTLIFLTGLFMWLARQSGQPHADAAHAD